MGTSASHWILVGASAGCVTACWERIMRVRAPPEGIIIAQLLELSGRVGKDRPVGVVQHGG
eukprot:117948-Pyramimonas_sp.AAC.1